MYIHIHPSMFLFLGCFTWIHIKCARLKKTHIPDTWYCTKCREKNPALISSKLSTLPKQKRIKTKSTSSLSSLGSSPLKPDDGMASNEVGEKCDEQKLVYISSPLAEQKIIGSRKRKMSASSLTSRTRNLVNNESTKEPSCHGNTVNDDSMDEITDVAFSIHKPGSTSTSSLPNDSGAIPHQSNEQVEKPWDDSGLESASVSPASVGLRPLSEEETDSSASSSGQVVPSTTKRSAKKKKLMPSINNENPTSSEDKKRSVAAAAR